MSQSGEKEWDTAFERLQKTNVASERTNIMYGLAGTPERCLINRYIVNSKQLKSQKFYNQSFLIDVPELKASVLHNRKYISHDILTKLRRVN